MQGRLEPRRSLTGRFHHKSIALIVKVPVEPGLVLLLLLTLTESKIGSQDLPYN